MLVVVVEPAEPAHAEHEVPYYRRSRLLGALEVRYLWYGHKHGHLLWAYVSLCYRKSMGSRLPLRWKKSAGSERGDLLMPMG